MKKLSVLLLITFIAISCSKKSDTSTTTTYSDKLELGTALNPNNLFELIGKTTTFTTTSTIYFRLESADDMGGSAVTINIDKQDGTAYSSVDFPNPQSYGHILLSAFAISQVGNYKATAILVNGNKTVASVNFVIN